MRFGSVEFFKVLIKTVLAIFFFVPLAAAIVLGILYANKSSELSEAVKEKERQTLIADIIAGEKAGTAEDFIAIFDKSGISYTEFIRLANSEKKITAENFYNILAAAGLNDKDILTLIASKKSVNAREFNDILTKNGISDADMIAVIASKTGTDSDSWRELLTQAGLSASDISSLLGGGTQSTSIPEQQKPSESGPYAAIHTDMRVDAPEKYIREEGTIYLTFDDGPSQYTYSILHYLKKNNVKATFFVVPARTEECYSTLKAIAADGHTIGVHSASHEYGKIYASVEAYLEDFYEAWDMIYEATGERAEIFRFPGGSVNDFNGDVRDDIIAEMSRRGFRFFDWNVDSGDVMGASWTEMYSSIPSDVKANYRSVVLMHDASTTKNTVLVLDDILRLLLSEGYKFDKINRDTEPVQYTGPFA